MITLKTEVIWLESVVSDGHFPDNYRLWKQYTDNLICELRRLCHQDESTQFEDLINNLTNDAGNNNDIQCILLEINLRTEMFFNGFIHHFDTDYEYVLENMPHKYFPGYLNAILKFVQFFSAAIEETKKMSIHEDTVLPKPYFQTEQSYMVKRIMFLSDFQFGVEVLENDYVIRTLQVMDHVLTKFNLVANQNQTQIIQCAYIKEKTYQLWNVDFKQMLTLTCYGVTQYTEGYFDYLQNLCVNFIMNIILKSLPEGKEKPDPGAMVVLILNGDINFLINKYQMTFNVRETTDTKITFIGWCQILSLNKYQYSEFLVGENYQIYLEDMINQHTSSTTNLREVIQNLKEQVKFLEVNRAFSLESQNVINTMGTPDEIEELQKTMTNLDSQILTKKTSVAQMEVLRVVINDVIDTSRKSLSNSQYLQDFCNFVSYTINTELNKILQPEPTYNANAKVYNSPQNN
jgi:hypothetical protein